MKAIRIHTFGEPEVMQLGVRRCSPCCGWTLTEHYATTMTAWHGHLAQAATRLSARIETRNL